MLPGMTRLFRRATYLWFAIHVIRFAVVAWIDVPEREPSQFETCSFCDVCPTQKRHFDDRLARLRTAEEMISDELRMLASTEVSRTAELRAELKSTRRQLKIADVQMPEEGLPYLFGVVLSMAAILFVRRRAITHVLPRFKRSQHSWHRPFVLFGLLMAGAAASRMFLTSVFVENKEWFDYTSYCISQSAFWLGRGLNVTFGFCVAWVITVAWLATDVRECPTSIDLNDSHCGVGPYLRGLQVLFVVTAIGFTVYMVLWLGFAVANQATFQHAYLLTPAVYLGLITAVCWRVVLRHLDVRRSYYRKAAKLFGNYKERIENVPPDPTKPFLGDSIWVFTTRVVALLAAIWAVLQWSGITDVLARLL